MHLLFFEWDCLDILHSHSLLCFCPITVPFSSQSIRLGCHRYSMSHWIPQRVKLYHPPCLVSCRLTFPGPAARDWKGTVTKTSIFGDFDLSEHEEMANEHFISHNNRRPWAIFHLDYFQPRLMLAVPIRTKVYKNGQLLAKLQDGWTINLCSDWSELQMD